jgi:hypothetical protein
MLLNLGERKQRQAAKGFRASSQGQGCRLMAIGPDAMK